MPFDPDEFLARRSAPAAPAGGFDPDAWIAQRGAPAPVSESTGDFGLPRNPLEEKELGRPQRSSHWPYVANPDTSWIDLRGAGRAVKGAAKTVAGLGVGAADIAGYGGTKPVQGAKKWATSPPGSYAEYEGGLLPYAIGGTGRMFQKGFGALSPTLGKLAGIGERGLYGGTIAGLDPTPSRAGRASDAEWGAGMSAVLGVPIPARMRSTLGRAINSAIFETIAEHLGHPGYGLAAGLYHAGPGHWVTEYLPKIMQHIGAGAVGAGSTAAQKQIHGAENGEAARSP